MRAFRQLFENEMTERLTDMIEKLTGRRVLTYQSQVMFDPNLVFRCSSLTAPEPSVNWSSMAIYRCGASCGEAATRPDTAPRQRAGPHCPPGLSIAAAGHLLGMVARLLLGVVAALRAVLITGQAELLSSRPLTWSARFSLPGRALGARGDRGQVAISADDIAADGRYVASRLVVREDRAGGC